MLYLVISSLLGVIFFKDLNVNFYIFLLLSLTSLLLFFKVNNRNYKIFLLALFIFYIINKFQKFSVNFFIFFKAMDFNNSL